ncbi:response regulator [Achromobacter xylosoxidans]|uniref:response regulator transcription factor n=1 Tax=Achromobacter TaxID=222 RepID=UPI0006C5ABC8|nr:MULTISPECIES: response regulator transcription factor [Achromobacter]OFU81517.1 DNA-binding response regulator [Achromobacter xylosoxidans]PWY52630.1 DNA-binding response regulator [Achromobacter sp. RW408]CUJ40360.1 Capsular synthesis regulator component B [Achromobacter xylosoxidans]CUK20375.1 Capsular synthesis regulator component B [Achromobacter xylosoxidans]
MTRILLADDHQVVILGVRNVLEGVARYQIVGEALSATELIRKARELTPDIIITDYNMPSEDGYGDGLALVQYLRRNFPRVRILIHTMISSPVIVASLYEEGVSGVLFKSGDLAEILTALGALENNQIYRSTPQALAANHPGGAQDAATRIARLSPKELEVLRHFLSGTSVGDIARIMNRSVKTVSTHKIAAMRKLDVETDHELVMFGVNHDLFK